jgi:hypothetical protein
MENFMAKEPKQYKPGYPRPGAGRQMGKKYPHLVVYTGILSEVRMAWNRMKAQAKYRNEEWDLSWEDFQIIWEGKWHLRGSVKRSLGLIRKDWSKGWSLANVEIQPREEIMRRQGHARRGKTYSKKPKDE